MPWFRCLLRGENFPLLVMDVRKPMGFYTTRYAEAASPEDAERLVLNALRDEEALKVPPDTLGTQNARIYFDEIDEVDGPGVNEGFTFFPEES
jgi:hypothetical protein